MGERLVVDDGVLRQLLGQLFGERRHVQRNRHAIGAVSFQVAGALLFAFPVPIRSARSRAACCCACDMPVCDRLGQQAQGRLRVADQPERDRMVLGDVVGIEIDVNDLGIRAERVFEHRKNVGKHIGAADHHRVGLCDVLAARRCPNMCPVRPR